jgi:hypothetical protein
MGQNVGKSCDMARNPMPFEKLHIKNPNRLGLPAYATALCSGYRFGWRVFFLLWSSVVVCRVRNAGFSSLLA